MGWRVIAAGLALPSAWHGHGALPSGAHCLLVRDVSPCGATRTAMEVVAMEGSFPPQGTREQVRSPSQLCGPR